VTEWEIRAEPDGTRVYSNYGRYRPVSDEDRKYARRKPDRSDAVLWCSLWYLPFDVLPEEARTMPDTSGSDTKLIRTLRRKDNRRKKILRSAARSRPVPLHPPAAGTVVGSSADPWP
jgi:hypothetical protein